MKINGKEVSFEPNIVDNEWDDSAYAVGFVCVSIEPDEDELNNTSFLFDEECSMYDFSSVWDPLDGLGYIPIDLRLSSNFYKAIKESSIMPANQFVYASDASECSQLVDGQVLYTTLQIDYGKLYRFDRTSVGSTAHSYKFYMDHLHECEISLEDIKPESLSKLIEEGWFYVEK